MIRHELFEDAYWADTDRWSSWKDFCYWVDKFIADPVQTYVEQVAGDACDHDMTIDIECLGCGAWL